MPTEHAGFAMHPVGFFDRSPVLDVQPEVITIQYIQLVVSVVWSILPLVSCLYCVVGT
jgi:hypothetical protein